MERPIKRMRRHKAQGIAGITSDVIKPGEGGWGGEPIVLTYLTNIYNIILKAKQIPNSWHEAKKSLCLKRETLKTSRTICL